MKRRDRENNTPLSISLCNQSQITNTHHKEVTLNPTKPTHPLCTQPTPQARITLTLQDFTTVLQSVI